MKIANNLHAFVWESMTANNCNAYLIDGPTRVLIDPGHRALFEHVELGLKDLKLTTDDIDLIICTHAHPDHLEGVQLFKQKSTLFSLHATEWNWVETAGKQMSAAFGIDTEALIPDFFLKEGTLSLDGLEMEVFLTPGHSPGSICLYWPLQKALFSGDLVFKEGLGRTDLPGGDSQTLKESIKRMSQLDVELLLAGHGDIVSGAQEVESNFEQIEDFWFRYV
jgi:glyoxylase-like metal-dependent hydrolase (beta-lactamase superfamily II)